MTNRSKMILGLASLLGVTAGATAVSGFAWFVTTKTAEVNVTNIGVYNNNPSLSVTIGSLKGVTRTNNAENNFDLKAANDTTSTEQEFTAAADQKVFVLTDKPLSEPTVYVDGVEDNAHTYDGDKTITFTNAPGEGKKVRVIYCDKAALTDVSSLDGIKIYNPTWETAYEGRRATLIPEAVAGEHYISFDLNFAAANTGSLKVFLDRPTITAKTGADEAEQQRNDAAASVARVAFSIGSESKLILSKTTDNTANKGIKQSLVETYPGDPAITPSDPSANKDATQDEADYAVSEVLDTCTNLYAPINTNYSIRSTAPDTTAANMYLTTITNAPVTIHVSIWLEGTSKVNGEGNYSDPIGGEIDVRLPIVAFGA